MKYEPEVFDPAKVSIVTTCMNRNEFLCQALPTWLGIGFTRIVIVDWNSREPVSKYLDERIENIGNHDIVVVRSDRHEMNEYFNLGWARNTGARLCATRFLFFVDSDIKIPDKQILFDRIVLDPAICYRGNVPGGYGTCLVDRARFNNVNGYNERMWSWGGEDLDLYIRLKVEQGCEIETFFPDQLLEHIHHDDGTRVRYRLQEWDNLKEGANIQRLERPQWTVRDQQRKVAVALYEKKTGRVRKQNL